MSKDADHKKSPDSDPNREKSPGFFAIILSTIAAAFGVQSEKNYQRDFNKGNIWIYIASGLIFTIIFIVVVAAVVSAVLANH
ncbi:MAG: hypothetical protein AseanaTS_18690 [Candidatus Pelagadaptatus aseana]|uniref:DUF2970 domain-containing protein n=1 Tax=Candidatus Pelagadaptatus aseana TaxID=3120508 RepID=UPI0039B2401B